VKTLFFDVDTQLDFLYPAGALAVPGAQLIVPGLVKLTRYAAGNNIQIVSTADAHSEDDPEFKVWKPHCVTETVGQAKASGTLLSEALVVANRKLREDNLGANAELAPQIIVEKQSIDCFTNPNLTPLLSLIRAERYVVYGVATEHCVERALSGLLKTGAQVELVEDAVCGISHAEVDATLSHFCEQGGRITTVQAVTGG
jgi:nicotinamidase/pyrazinamidase